MVREFRRTKVRRDDLQGPGEFGSAGSRSSTRTVSLQIRARGTELRDEALMSAVLGRPFPTEAEREEWER